MLLARTAQFRFADDLHARHGLALGVFLLVDFAVAIDGRNHAGRKGVDAGYTYTMQTTADLVGAFVELTTGMEHGHDNLKGTLVFLFVHIDGDTATVVLNSDAIVFVDGDLNVCTITCEGLVNRVVYGLVNQMVETLFRNVSDVHGRALAHGFQSFKDLDVRGRILGLILFFYVIIFFHNSKTFLHTQVPCKPSTENLFFAEAQPTLVAILNPLQR